MTTLVTFLGLGRFDRSENRYVYETVTYVSPTSDNKRVETCYVARALAEIYEVQRVRVLSTDEAWNAHGASLAKALDELNLSIERIPIKEGRSENELRDQFRKMRDALAVQDDLVIDITHGFRAQPFFAATALFVMHAANKLPANTQITYAFVDRDTKEAPIWDLTPFLMQQRLASGLAVFTQTGHATPLIDALKDERRRLAERKKRGERESYDETGNLISTLEKFANDLATLRLPFMMTDIKDGAGSAKQLLNSLKAYGPYCDKAHPALLPLLNKLKGMVSPLAIGNMASSERPQAMRHLANLYMGFSRFLEAAAVAREEIVNRVATGDALLAGTEQFDNKARHAAERLASENKAVRNLFDTRNDLLHCGMRRQPTPANSIGKNVKRLVEAMELADLPSPRTIFVTRHTGAKEWAKRQGIVVDEIVEHLDPETINPGDLVIGTLPVHLAAEICRCGGRYKHLSMTIPPEHRGRELSADDMEAFGATLEEFRILPVTTDEREAADA